MPETSEDGQDVRRARPPELENRASQNSLFPKGRCVAWGKTITELHIYGKRTGVLQNERSGRKHVTAALRSSTYGEQRARRPPEAACKKRRFFLQKIARRTRETSRTVAQTPENGCRRRSSRRQPPQGSRRIADTGDQPPLPRMPTINRRTASRCDYACGATSLAMRSEYTRSVRPASFSRSISGASLHRASRR